MTAVTFCSDFGAPQNGLSLFPLFPHLFAMKWQDQMLWSSFSEYWALSQLFHSLTFIKRLFSSSSISAISVVSSAYLKLLIFLPTILIPACASSSPAFLMMYSAYKLNKQGQYTALTYSFPNLEPVCCSVSSSNYCFLTCTQTSQEAGQVVWYPISLRTFHSLLWSTQSKVLA